MDIQHVNIKLFAAPGSAVHWPDLIPIFHRWIQRHSLPESLIDVADYAHVPAGPGVMLIAQEAFYSVDNREDQLGFLYNRRVSNEGDTREKLSQAYAAALSAAGQLEAEPELNGKLKFDPRRIELTINDRMLAPNTEETYKELSPEATRFFSEQWAQPVRVTWKPAPRDLFRMSIAPEN